jgi:phage tail-like protein
VPNGPANTTDELKGTWPVTSGFLLEVDDVQIGVFTEASGLSMEVEVYPHEEGGQNGFTHKLPGRITFPNITLKKGITDSDALFKWVSQSSGDGFTSAKNKLKRHTGAITLLGTDGSRLRAWNFIDAFAVKWSGPTLTATGIDSLEEEIEIAHHGFTSK